MEFGSFAQALSEGEERAAELERALKLQDEQHQRVMDGIVSSSSATAHVLKGDLRTAHAQNERLVGDLAAARDEIHRLESEALVVRGQTLRAEHELEWARVQNERMVGELGAAREQFERLVGELGEALEQKKRMEAQVRDLTVSLKKAREERSSRHAVLVRECEEERLLCGGMRVRQEHTEAENTRLKTSLRELRAAHARMDADLKTFSAEYSKVMFTIVTAKALETYINLHMTALREVDDKTAFVRAWMDKFAQNDMGSYVDFVVTEKEAEWRETSARIAQRDGKASLTPYEFSLYCVKARV